MSSRARNGVATKELLRQVAGRTTGRVTIDTVDGRIEVYLMNGEIIGAISPADDQALLRRVRISDAISPEKLASLTRLAASEQSLFGQLIDVVPTEVIEPALADRFLENLVIWVSQSEEPSFEPLPGVFIDNMQMGHNTIQIIESCCSVSDRALSYPLNTEIVRGVGKTIDQLESSIQELSSNQPTSIESMLEELPSEPTTTRAAFARMLDTGLLLEGGVELQELFTDEVELLRTEPIDLSESDDDDDAPTVLAGNELLDLDDDSSPDAKWAAVEKPEASVVPSPNDLSKWLHTGDIDEEDMACFEDHERDRGGGAGAFSTESHNLEKVDFNSNSPSTSVSTTTSTPKLEVSPAAKFAAPVISEEVAVQKIVVCNDVLIKVASAFDSIEGSGSGKAVVQLLMDGAPSKFSAVLHNLTVSNDGQILVEEVLDNLAGRPVSEHRRLLNSALKDAMERALSSAADKLPDDVFDSLYEAVAGYNQRLGL